MLIASQALAALALLYFGAELLIRGASTLALRAGVSSLAVGLTVVAFGTSAPEMVVSLQAALRGASDISIGNVVGSNIANIALILGISALLRPIRVEAKLVRIDAPLMVLVSLLLAALLRGGTITRLEGLLLLAGLVAYTVFTFRQARAETRSVREEMASAAPPPQESLWDGGLRAVAGLALLVAGGQLLVSAALGLGPALGISEAVIGLTIVAVGTSLPELATSIVASYRGQGDIAAGNVVGSNLFNILGILGVTALVAPLPMGNVGWIDIGTMLLAAVALAIMIATHRSLSRVEGALLLAGYIVYSWSLVAVSSVA